MNPYIAAISVNGNIYLYWNYKCSLEFLIIGLQYGCYSMTLIYKTDIIQYISLLDDYFSKEKNNSQNGLFYYRVTHKGWDFKDNFMEFTPDSDYLSPTSLYYIQYNTHLTLITSLPPLSTISSVILTWLWLPPSLLSLLNPV